MTMPWVEQESIASLQGRGTVN